MNPSYLYTVTEFTSPIGYITLISSRHGLSNLLFESAHRCIGNFEISGINFKIQPHEENPAARQLMEYFNGQRKVFTIPLNMNGTPFRQQIWKTLLTIPYGKSLSYGEIALRIGKPNASRAVGQACGANPIPIIIPCHRVLTSTGKIGGYSGGTDIKNALLKLEGVKLST